MIAYPLRVGGTMTRIVESGGGPALILVHGFGTRADRWRGNIEGLAAAGRRVVAFDLPGHGFAAKGPGFDYSIGGYARFLGAVLDAVGIERASVVGASLGGHIAAAFAVNAPARVESLTMVGSTGLGAFGAETRTQMSRMLIDMSREAIRARLQRGLRNAALITDALVEEDYRINNSPGAAEAFAALGGYFGERIDDDLVLAPLAALGTRLPLLLVWGDDDLSVPVKVAEAALPKLPGGRLAVLAGTAHNPYVDKPETFNRVLLDFLAGLLGSFKADDVSYR